MGSSPTSEPKCFGDGPQWRRNVDEGREEGAVMKRSNLNSDDSIRVDLGQPDAEADAVAS